MAAMASSTIKTHQNLETYSLIWLDAYANSSNENIQVQQKLQEIIYNLLIFDNEQQFLHYFKNISENDRIILIVSGSFGRNVVPNIANRQQIISIFIYCFDKKANEQWSKHFTKVKLRFFV